MALKKILNYFLEYPVAILYYLIATSLLSYTLYRAAWKNATLQDITSLVAATAATFSIGYVVQQIQQSIEQQKVSTSKDFIMKFLDVDLFKAIRETRNFFKDTPIPEQVQLIEQDAELKRSMLLTFNFFECVGIFYDEKKLDRDIIREVFTLVSTKIYAESEKYIIHTRQEFNSQMMYVYWKTMNLDMARKMHLIRSDFRDVKK